MLRKLAIAALLTTSILAPASASYASSDVVLTDALAQKIRMTLEGQGYSVGKIKVEDGLFEAYAKKDSKKFEIYLNAQMEIVRTVED